MEGKGCGGTISDLFPVVTGVPQGCVLALTLFSTCVDWGHLWGGCRRDQAVVHHLGMSRSLTLISQMMQSSLWRLDILLGALKVLNEESEPLGLRVSWVKTKIQAFNDIFDAVVQSIAVCGEDVEDVERFTCLGSDIYVSAVCEPEVNRRLGRAWGVMDSLDHEV